jgi:hypothetical protein
MQPDQPFEFSKDNKILSMPICWTNEPENLYRKLDMPIETIEEK